MIRFLVDDKHADVYQKDSNGNTLLHAAAWNGQLNVIKYLVEEKKMGVNVRDSDNGFTPLIEAIKLNKVHVFQYLLRVRGVDVNMADNQGSTPLHFAVKTGFLEVVRNLVSKGANIHAKDQHGRTALYGACDGSFDKPGRLNTVRYFIEEKGCDPFQKDNYGNTLFHAAESNGSLDVAKYLVEEKRIDMNVKNNNG